MNDRRERTKEGTNEKTKLRWSKAYQGRGEGRWEGGRTEGEERKEEGRKEDGVDNDERKKGWQER